MCPVYTKTFGGKIWNNLHSVSPETFFRKKIENGFPYNFPPKIIWTSPRAKKLEVRTPICFLPLKQKRCFILLTEWTSSKQFTFSDSSHEMMFRIKTFFHQCSFVTQDKWNEIKNVLALTVWNKKFKKT